MTKTALTVALAAMMTAAAPLAYAQTTAPMQNTPSTSRATQSSFTTGSGELRASKLIGSSVYDVQNEKIGSVQDIVLDRDGKVAGVIIDVGSFLGAGGKDVAISLNDIKMTNDRLTLDRSKDQLKSAQPYHLTNDKNG
ncbi:MAG TPA: PRC-barrel domain-containing protein [Stellaceae bacterium]|nr:PRC-barrel domain-containing protein [Stellaceae bacterium]